MGVRVSFSAYSLSALSLPLTARGTPALPPSHHPSSPPDTIEGGAPSPPDPKRGTPLPNIVPASLSSPSISSLRRCGTPPRQASEVRSGRWGPNPSRHAAPAALRLAGRGSSRGRWLEGVAVTVGEKQPAATLPRPSARSEVTASSPVVLEKVQRDLDQLLPVVGAPVRAAR